MQFYADIHLHALYGVDDGAHDKQQMFDLIDREYESGCRVVCVTPHFNYALFGDNLSQRAISYKELCDYAVEKYPDLQLFIGNELRYCEDSIAALANGECKTLSDSRYVLVDFDYGVSVYELEHSLLRLLSYGYIPVLAHFELYIQLQGNIKKIRELRERGVLFQSDADSVTGRNGRKAMSFAKKCIGKSLVDVIASDAHNLDNRSPELLQCASIIKRKFSSDTVNKLMYENPLRILNNDSFFC